MNLHQWLSEEDGRATRMAADFGVSRSAVSQWRSSGAPTRFLRRIVEATGGAVSLEELLIDKESRRGAIDDADPSLPTQEPSHVA
jgi:DNA-binding transcriptional regulator YdaS (Cro superfamily)